MVVSRDPCGHRHLARASLTPHCLLQLQEKSQVLEGSVAGLDQKLKGLNDHCLALSWKLDLQERTVDLKLSQVRRKTHKEGQ